MRRNARVWLLTTTATSLAAIGAVAMSFSDVGTGQSPPAPGQIDTTYVPIEPCRLFDLRPGFGDRTAPLGPEEVYTQQVTGRIGDCNVPADATGVVMNVTVVMPTAESHLTVFPANVMTVPTVSSLNWIAGQPPTPNAVDVKLSPDGKVKFFNLNGDVFVLADVVGYHTPTSLRALAAGGAPPTIPSGMTVSGNIVYSEMVAAAPDGWFQDDIGIDLPGVAPEPLGQDRVNFGRDSLPSNYDADPTCTGTPDDPSAPPGKVCIYVSFLKHFESDVETHGTTIGPLENQGFGIQVTLDPAPIGKRVILRGSWAYTAP